MDDNRIDSRGFSVGRWCFPAFSLRRGECITLCLPKEARVDGDRMIACLTGAEPVAGLKIRGPVVFAAPATPPSGWRRWFHDPTPFHWLRTNSTLSDDAIRSFLREHGMDPPYPLSRYAGNPRTFLGLAAAYAHKPDVVVFSTSGLDPSGVRETHRIVTQHLSESSAINLAWPLWCPGHEHHDIFRDSATFVVIDNGASAPGVSAASAL